MNKTKNYYSNEEEFANWTSHFLGMILTFIGSFFVWNALVGENDFFVWLVNLVFMISLGMVFTSSTIYHFLVDPKKKAFWQKLDHISIYFLIAGSYGPFMLAYADMQTAALILGTQWSLVFLGGMYKLFWFGRFPKLSVILYLLMGWLIVFVGRDLLSAMPDDVFWKICLGGLCYTVGVFFYVSEKIRFGHAIWHLFVLGGSIFHFLAALSILQ